MGASVSAAEVVSLRIMARSTAIRVVSYFEGAKLTTPVGLPREGVLTVH